MLQILIFAVRKYPNGLDKDDEAFDFLLDPTVGPPAGVYWVGEDFNEYRITTVVNGPAKFFVS
jgi:hypothetical protein